MFFRNMCREGNIWTMDSVCNDRIITKGIEFIIVKYYLILWSDVIFWLGQERTDVIR